MAEPKEFYIILDGPSEHEAGRFVEVEDGRGGGVKAGKWTKRADGFWQLGPFVEASVVGELVEALGDALDGLKELKARYTEAEGGWIVADFMGAATNESHWMHKVVKAEKAHTLFRRFRKALGQKVPNAP